MGAPPFSDADGFRARFKGYEGTASAGQTTDIDFLISGERNINGVCLILTNHADGDNVDFKIVDKDGIMSTAGTVLDTFGENWYVDDTIKSQAQTILPYRAKILAGLYVRVTYRSVGNTNVKVKANLYLHWKAA